MRYVVPVLLFLPVLVGCGPAEKASATGDAGDLVLWRSPDATGKDTPWLEDHGPEVPSPDGFLADDGPGVPDGTAGDAEAFADQVESQDGVAEVNDEEVPCVPGAESCNGKDDDCDGEVDEPDSGALCQQPWESCVAGECKSPCWAPGEGCDEGFVCSVGNGPGGQCVPPGDPCLVTGATVECGEQWCGPGTLCHPQLQTCVPDLPCHALHCVGPACAGMGCACTRPSASCTAPPITARNDPSFTFGLVDLDFDLNCGAWAVTIISGPDYLRHVSSTGEISQVQGVTNLNMDEVAALQGINATFGGDVLEVALTYTCCNSCGCVSDPPKGVAWYDQANGALPLLIPAQISLYGEGPFHTTYLDEGPKGLTWGLEEALYVGNVQANGDFYTVDLATQTIGLVTTFPHRVWAACPFDGDRLLVALADGTVRLLYTGDGSDTLFAETQNDVTSMVRDPFTGRVYLSFFGGEVRVFSSGGKDLGPFALGTQTGRVSISPDGFLFHLNVAPVGTASVERFELPGEL